jgi:hypothetical protein
MESGMHTGNPWFDFWTQVTAPLSGDVSQRFGNMFSPTMTVNMAGNAAIEARVVQDVASYGAQIGWISEIALALAEGKTPPKDALKKLADAAKKIEAIKKDSAQSAAQQAESALERLKKQDAEAYRALLRHHQ